MNERLEGESMLLKYSSLVLQKKLVYPEHLRRLLQATAHGSSVSQGHPLSLSLPRLASQTIQACWKRPLTVLPVTRSFAAPTVSFQILPKDTSETRPVRCVHSSLQGTCKHHLPPSSTPARRITDQSDGRLSTWKRLLPADQEPIRGSERKHTHFQYTNP